MRMKAVACAALLLSALASPALATIVVSIEPSYQQVLLSAGTATVDIVADIPENEAIIGFGIDLGLVGSSVLIDSVAVNGPPPAGPFDPLPTNDGDDLAGMIFPPGVLFGEDVLLATVTLSLEELGLTNLVPSHTLGDLTEGFPMVEGFAPVEYMPGSIDVIPEPASLALLGVLALLRRR